MLIRLNCIQINQVTSCGPECPFCASGAKNIYWQPYWFLYLITTNNNDIDWKLYMTLQSDDWSTRRDNATSRLPCHVSLLWVSASLDFFLWTAINFINRCISETKTDPALELFMQNILLMKKAMESRQLSWPVYIGCSLFFLLNLINCQ